MKTIPVKYIDTTKYVVRASYDTPYDCPNDWGCFEVKIFGCRDLNNCKREDFYDDNDNLAIGMRSKLRAGTAWPVAVRHYSGTDGGYYSVADKEDDCDGFIIFTPDYVKGVSLEERKRYAKQDLETYQEWANGEIYYVEITTEDGREVDSCGGIYGDHGLKAFIEEAIGDAEHKTYMVYEGRAEQLQELAV